MTLFAEETIFYSETFKFVTKGQWTLPNFGANHNNAYKLELLGEYGLHTTFNVSELSWFDACNKDELKTSKENS